MRFLLTAVAVLLAAAPLRAQDPEFIRVVRNDAGEIIAMETAVVRYEKGEGADKVALDAIGAIHIGDKAYYDALNEQFRGYEALCYELVGKRDERPKKAGGFDVYGMVGTFLRLEGQLGGIDYSPENFVHADMTPEEIQAKMDERGDDAVTLALSALVESLRARNLAARRGSGTVTEPAMEDLLAGPVHLKRFLAEGFATDMNGSGLGPTADLYMIKDRNAAAMKVVDEQFSAGKKNVGLFYGAAHFPDFHKKLVERGFRPAGTTWVRAWDLSRPQEWDLEGILKEILEAQN